MDVFAKAWSSLYPHGCTGHASHCLRDCRIAVFRPTTRECTRLDLSAVNLVFLHLHKPLISLFCNFPSAHIVVVLSSCLYIGSSTSPAIYPLCPPLPPSCVPLAQALDL